MKSVKLRAEDVARLFHNALLVAATDDWRPGLNAVRLLVRETRAYAIGTDPYSLAVDSCEPVREGDPKEAAPTPFELTVPRGIAEQVEDEANALVRRFKKAKTPTDKALITITDADAMRNGARIVLQEQTHEFAEPSGFPAGIWKVLYPEVTKPYAPVRQVAFGPFLFSRFQKVQPPQTSCVFRFRGDLNPIEIELGPTFRALLMPVRVPSIAKNETTTAGAVAEAAV